MKTLLRIDSSSRIKGSHSRALADYVEKRWREENPEGKVISRDLVDSQLPHIHNSTIVGFYTPLENWSEDATKATALSDMLIAELKAADELLISSPLYNLNIPSNLKAYFDQVVRIGHTFNIDQEGYYGLLENKIAYVVTVKGGVYKDTFMEQYDFQEPYLKAILGHMGIKQTHLFSLEGTTDSDTLEQNKKKVHELIDESFKTKTDVYH